MAESIVESNLESNLESNFVDTLECISNHNQESLGPNILDHDSSNGLHAKVRVMLENNPLWDEFHVENTEMIITKAGRRMFPEIRIHVFGLVPDERYIMVMDLVPFDDNRYKYHENEWVVAGKADPPVQGRLYIHPDSPSLGREWMKQPISFQKMKLTNNNLDQNGYIILNSMHKYQARIHIVLMDMTDEKGSRRPSSFSTHTFKETVFYAVTAYQNPKITKLKIKYNAFAKGFRSSDSAHFYADGTFGASQQYFGPIDSTCPSTHAFHSFSQFPKQEATSPNLPIDLPHSLQGSGNRSPSDQERVPEDFFYGYPSMMEQNQSYMQPSQAQHLDPSPYLAASTMHQTH